MKIIQGAALSVVSTLIKAIIVGISALILDGGVRQSQAFEEVKVYRGVLVLEGRIVSGDYDRLYKFLRPKENFDKISGGVFLASPGGNVIEAMKIGRLIRALQLSVDAPSGPPSGIPKFGESLIRPNHIHNPRANYACTSACFFIYVSGVYRTPMWIGRLGVHRPIRSDSSLMKLSADDEQSLTWRIRHLISDYLKDMNVPGNYIDFIYSVPPNEVRWISQVEFDSDLQEYVPALADQISNRCGLRVAREGAGSAHQITESAQGELAKPTESSVSILMPEDRSEEALNCIQKVRMELSNEGWKKVFLGN